MAIAAVNRAVKKASGNNQAEGIGLKGILKLDTSRKVTTKEVIFFTSQLSLMTEIGSPLNVSLSTIENQLKNPAFKKVVREIINEVEGGSMLSHAMKKYPHIFSDAYVSLVRAGEDTGQLKTMLDRVVAIQEKQQKFMDMLMKALTYPAILCLVSLVVVFFLLTYVFPRFSALFMEIEDILPPTTKMLMFFSDMVRSYWHAGAAAVALAFWGVYILLKSERGKLLLDTLKLKVPPFANVFVKIYLIQMMRTMGFLMDGNVLIMEALSITRRGISNMVFRGFLDRVISNVEEGRGTYPAFAESSLIPDNAKQIIKTGEESQNLSKVMIRLADFYEGEIDHQLKKLSAIIEPALLIMVGLVVGVIVISLILPIFKLSKAMH